jgi:tRNA dimethylallyltransferase
VLEKLKSVLILTGETASGKSDLAVALALHFGAEIVGADSRQIYRGMSIGTAAPTREQQALVPHHLVEFLEPNERYSAARYVADALTAIDAIHARGQRVIVVGGTGFYIRALCGDVALGPEVDLAARARIQREAALHDSEFLYEWLRLRNPQRAAELSAGDGYRITRALETLLAERESDMVCSHESLRSRGLRFQKYWIQSERDVLHERICRRVDTMLMAGFIEEAERVGPEVSAANAVGYTHAAAYLGGQLSHDELRKHLARVTTRYAKRQATWLRSEPGLTVLRHDTDRFKALVRYANTDLDWET